MGTHLLPPFLFPAEERLHRFVWLLYLQRNRWLVCCLLKVWFFFAWGQTAARLPWYGLSSAEPLRSLGTCWPVNSGLLPPRKPFRSNPEHFSAVFLTSVQPSSSWLGSSAQICPFLLNPITGLLILHLLPASAGATSTSEITTSSGIAALGTGSKEKQGPAKSLMRLFYASIDHPSATHGVWHNYLVWFPLLRQPPSWGDCSTVPPSKSITLPVLFSTPVPPLLQKDERHLPEPFLRSWSLKWT